MIYPHFATEESIELQQYISTAVQYDSTGLSTFVDYLSYLGEHDFYDPRADRVTLMTIHASKGLEFEVVCICGFEEGIIPFVRKGMATNLEEERRLLYVALTRAKQNIYLLCPSVRRKNKTTVTQFFAPLKESGMITLSEDDEIARMKKRRALWKNKKSQLSLF